MFEFPLTKANRLQLAQAFRHVDRVDLTIDCVVEGQMGKVWVDQLDQPTVFQIQTGPFSYLAGEPEGIPAQELFHNLPADMLLMPSAPGWLEAARTYFVDRLCPFDRYRFSDEHLSPEHLHSCLEATPFAERIERIDLGLAQNVWGRDHFIDLMEYESPQDFMERGIGTVSSQHGSILGAAYASLVCSRGIEVSIYIEEEFRRQGLATALASALLLWCLERGLEPHWDAANPESWRLASKLGYQFLGSYEAYYLWNH